MIEAFAKARRVFVFTGAGASKESGLPTFRDIDGEWATHDPMTFATLEGFLREPVQVWNMYRLRQRQISQAQPNPGHIVIAQMENHYAPALQRSDAGGSQLSTFNFELSTPFLLCTQNVDDLHERAGSRRMVKIHGDCWGMRCLECEHVRDTRELDLPEEFTSETLPMCDRCGALCRPNIVWFGEHVPYDALTASINAAAECDLMLIVGTSGEVSSGYGLAEYAESNNATIVEINPTEGHLTRHAHIWIPEPAGIALPRIWQAVTQAQ